jgi:hypothetical protein
MRPAFNANGFYRSQCGYDYRRRATPILRWPSKRTRVTRSINDAKEMRSIARLPGGSIAKSMLDGRPLRQQLC